jgi:membrane protease YdiL (CAAX protease family)
MTLTNNISTFILLILFYIGWVKFPISGDAIYLVDYLIRSLMLIVMWKERNVLICRPNWPQFRFWLIFFIFFVAITLLHQALYYFQFTYDLNNFFYKAETFSPIENVFLLAFDMTAGLFLVAITEEFLFRYKLNEILRSKHIGIRFRYIITSTLFSLIHAPQGLVSIGETFLWGLLFFFLYQKAQSIHFLIVIHFLTNFVIFGLMAIEDFLR